MSALLVVLLLGAGIYAGDSSPLMTLLKNAWLAPSAWLLWRAWKDGFPGGTYIIVGSMSLIASSVLVGLLHFLGIRLMEKDVHNYNANRLIYSSPNQNFASRLLRGVNLDLENYKIKSA